MDKKTLIAKVEAKISEYEKEVKEFYGKSIFNTNIVHGLHIEGRCEELKDMLVILKQL